jgi:hypothetical protein
MKELMAELDACADAGQRVTLWLRDDDAVAVTPALDRLLALILQWDVPAVLAVIPVPARPELPVRLGVLGRVRVAPHGFAHSNHAGPGEKKQELGPHRPAATVLDEIRVGFDRLKDMFPDQTVPLLVPPWNRIAPDLLPRLPELGLNYLSAFGQQIPLESVPRLTQIDCQLDIIDWSRRRSHPPEMLAGRLAALVRQCGAAQAPIGILTHHIDHDEAAWAFLADLFRLTAGHEAVSWSWPVPAFEAYELTPTASPAK